MSEPLIDVSESWVTTTFHRPTSELGTRTGLKQESGKSQGAKSAPRGRQVTAQVEGILQEDPNTLSDNMLQILSVGLEDLTAQVTAQVIWHCRRPRFANEIMEFLGLKHWKTFRVNDLQPLLEAVWLEMTVPDKPTSSKQKYWLTDKGRQLLARLGEDDG